MDNLIPFNKRTKSEQREICRKGGKASGASRRESREIYRLLQKFLTTKIKIKNLSEEKFFNFLKELGIKEKTSVRELMLLAQVLKSIHGNTKSYMALMDFILKYEGSFSESESQRLEDIFSFFAEQYHSREGRE